MDAVEAAGVAGLFVPIRALRASALARACASIWLTSGFEPPGVPGVEGRGDPLFDRALFWPDGSSSSERGLFSELFDTSAMVGGRYTHLQLLASRPTRGRIRTDDAMPAIGQSRGAPARVGAYKLRLRAKVSETCSAGYFLSLFRLLDCSAQLPSQSLIVSHMMFHLETAAIAQSLWSLTSMVTKYGRRRNCTINFLVVAVLEPRQ